MSYAVVMLRRDLLVGDLSKGERKAAIDPMRIVVDLLDLLLADYLLHRSRRMLRGVRKMRTVVCKFYERSSTAPSI